METGPETSGSRSQGQGHRVTVAASVSGETSKRTSDAFDLDGKPTLLATLGMFVPSNKIGWFSSALIWNSEGIKASIMTGLAGNELGMSLD